MVQGALSRALELGALNSNEAKTVLNELCMVGQHHTAAEEAMTSALLDIGLAMSISQPQQATVDALARRFSELLLFSELTSGEYGGEATAGNE